MKRAFLATATLLILALPSPVLAAAGTATLDGGQRRTESDRPSRRLLRHQARIPVTRNPRLLTVSALPLDAVYENSALGLKLQYPSAWERQDLMEHSPPLTLVAMFLSRTSTDDVRQNINLVIEDLPRPMSLAEYTEIGIDTEREIFDEFVIVESAEIPFLGSERAHRVIFTAPANGRTMAFGQLWTVRDRRAYVWTFADTAQSFEKHYPTFERMMDTLTMR